jgi:hypothetical protein
MELTTTAIAAALPTILLRKEKNIAKRAPKQIPKCCEFFAKSFANLGAKIVDSKKGCCDELTKEGEGEDSQGHKVMIHGVDENGGGSDGQRVARVETSLDSLPRYP